MNPRVHVGLISMHADAPRKNGGVGFSVTGAEGLIEVTLSDELSLVDERHVPFDTNEETALIDALEVAATELGLSRSAEIRIAGSLLTHVGMGSGTAIRLACIEGMAIANHGDANRADVSRRAILDHCGRGGTSGIGVNTYFSGGLILDLGHPQDGNSSVPSSQAAHRNQALALPVAQMQHWPMLLCLPRSIPSKSQDEELQFFARTLPLPPEASFEAAYVAMFQVYASALEGDYTRFCSGIEAMQDTEWKAAEIAEYGAPLRNLMRRLSEEGVDCVGMSSLGPMLYCFANQDLLNKIPLLADELDCSFISARPTNSGRKVVTFS